MGAGRIDECSKGAAWFGDGGGGGGGSRTDRAVSLGRAGGWGVELGYLIL